MNTPHLSVVVPVYRNTETVDILVENLSKCLRQIHNEYEIILVDDCCPENSWARIRENCNKDKRVVGLKLSRNFGQHAAITAGLFKARGEWIVVMDADLQDQPKEIVKLYNKAKEGYDVVLAQRKTRRDSFFTRYFSKLFYKVLGFLTETKLDSSIANFGLYHKKVIAAVLSMNDYIRYFPSMIRWVGFDLAIAEVEHNPRHSGKSSYKFSKLLRLGMNVVLSFSEKPLRLIIRFGILISVMGFLLAMYNLYKYFTHQITVLGFVSIITSIWILAGVIITIIGVVGLYVGRIFDQTKHRPMFIINQSINDEG